MHGREFAGTFAVGARTYEFTYTPASAAVVDGKIELLGTFGIAGTNRAPLSGVRAVLASTQGGLGEAPRVRRELLAMTAQGAATTTADAQDRASAAPAQTATGGLPITEATDKLGFVGVMYLRLSPLDTRALGVAADLSAVQLNARLAPTSEIERELHWLYSGLVMAALGEPRDDRATKAHVDAINTLLRG
jgi:hypothetical protein